MKESELKDRLARYRQILLCPATIPKLEFTKFLTPSATRSEAEGCGLAGPHC